MRRFVGDAPRPMIFDVGANYGQSVDKFKKAFPLSFIHSFEPSPITFASLKRHCSAFSDVHVWNLGVGACNGTLPFLENSQSDMSSFLPPSKCGWGEIVRTTDVKITTLDVFAEEQGVEFVHVLKSDTQGFDYEVFKGARNLMRQDKIGLIYFEFIFSDMYKNLPLFHDVFQYLSENRFDLVSFYDFHFQNELVSWADVLFVNRAFYRMKEQLQEVIRDDSGRG